MKRSSRANPLNSALPFLAILFWLLVSACSPTGKAKADLPNEVRMSQNFGVDLTNHFAVVHSVSWTASGKLRGNNEIVLLELTADPAQVGPFLAMVRSSPFYLSAFNPAPRPDYVSKAAWWKPGDSGKYDYARFAGSGGQTPRSMELFIRDDSTNITVFVSSTQEL